MLAPPWWKIVKQILFDISYKSPKALYCMKNDNVIELFMAFRFFSDTLYSQKYIPPHFFFGNLLFQSQTISEASNTWKTMNFLNLSLHLRRQLQPLHHPYCVHKPACNTRNGAGHSLTHLQIANYSILRYLSMLSKYRQKSEQIYTVSVSNTSHLVFLSLFTSRFTFSRMLTKQNFSRKTLRYCSYQLR